MSNSQKNFLSIRSKLIAAVAMLLVASFMVVSSTYAWFTLSTAPEVTGITTQIGANGNLEIALNTTNKLPGNSVGLGTTKDKNATWGNIIDLGILDVSNNSAYGLDQIVLKPSMLAVTTSNKMDSEAALWTPVYGSDGRVEKVDKNGFYGTWNGTGFNLQGSDAEEGYGVRALGTVSSMTAQQLAFKNAASTVKTSLENFNNTANLSLIENGGALVSLILMGVTSKESGFELAQLEPVDKLVSKLESSLPDLEKAIKNFMLLVVANTQSQKSDAEFELIVDAFNADWSNIFAQLKDDEFKTNYSITIAAFGEQGEVTFTVPAEQQAYAAKFADVAKTYDKIASQVAAARKAYNDVETAGVAVDWAGFQALLTPLMKVDALSINGKSYEELLEMKNAEDLNPLVNWGLDVLGVGVQVLMDEGSGVYEDIASVSKDINANFRTNVKVTFNNIAVDRENVSVRMYTEVADIVALDPVMVPSQAQRQGADADAVITDTYGYVLDFVFRTNAEGSNLLLQQGATDRIYSDNTGASDTMGGGSYMEFTTQTGFGVDQVKGLMDNVRLVFVNTKTGELLVGGYLDTENAVTGTTVKASVKLQAISVTDQIVTGKNEEIGEDIVETVTTPYIVWGEKLEAGKKQIITALGQNEAEYISVYVYLDGATTDNADVAATSALSTSGKLNLQFASDAELKPMDYSDLKNQGQTAESSSSETETPVTP